MLLIVLKTSQLLLVQGDSEIENSNIVNGKSKCSHLKKGIWFSKVGSRFLISSTVILGLLSNLKENVLSCTCRDAKDAEMSNTDIHSSVHQDQE